MFLLRLLSYLALFIVIAGLVIIPIAVEIGERRRLARLRARRISAIFRPVIIAGGKQAAEARQRSKLA